MNLHLSFGKPAVNETWQFLHTFSCFGPLIEDATMDRQLARGNFNAYFQNDPVGRVPTANRRVAICQVGLGGRNRVLQAISGTYYEPTVSPNVMESFDRMLATDQYATRNLFNCAETHLSVQLVELFIKPGSIDVFAARKVNGRAKNDSPCLNCQQWAKQEFKSLNPV